MSSRNLHLEIFWAAIFFASSALAQNHPITKSIVLNPINVTATRSERSPTQIPNSITQFNRTTVQEYQPGATLDEFARNTPGVFFQNQFNFAQDLRIAIRGFGARSPFGVRGIQMRVDGIPQTLPDGQTQLDSIDPALIQRMDIVRGPSAALYGNASGGLIDITTREAPYEKLVIMPRQVFGQYGYLKSEMFMGGRNGNFSYTLFGSHLQQEGWRDHSAMQNTNSQIKLNFQTSDRSDLMLVFREFYSPLSKDAGALTAAEVQANPRQASSRNIQFNAGEEIRQEEMAARFRVRPSAGKEFSITAHGSHRDFQSRQPFMEGGQVQFDRWVGGLAVQFISDSLLFQRPNRLLTGVDYGIQNDSRQRFNNNFGTRGVQNLNQIERVQSIGPYFRNEWSMTSKLDIVLGGRWDWLQYHVKDHYQSDGNQSGSRTVSQASGSAGAVYHITPHQQAYAHVGSVFEAPTTTELLNNPAGRGGFNANLNAQTSLSNELGMRGNIAGFHYDTAAFYIQTWNEIVPFELPSSPGRAFFRNAGQSRRMGIETRIVTPQWKGFHAEAGYTYSDFEFEKYFVNDINLKGNSMPGIPAHRWEGLIKYAHPFGFFGQLHVHRVGDFFVNDTNTANNRAYHLGQLLLGWEVKSNRLEGSIFLGINNLFDAPYSANIRINAALGRYYEPGPPLNVFGGLRFKIIIF
ncbi:MAG TPA: TonB-dependent receptor [Nitrosomonas sp.]|nr:TonB-dependent receptor [Nitrosomonas sp.]HRB32392.1 TonB-dependent receptor [Nitrosomonas sp.]HRB45231.1 TonB-dependent receptor [Nitrosomonas sp.]HRB76363.1 TonB-dependent receptor [Nitrosomonas sp.]